MSMNAVIVPTQVDTSKLKYSEPKLLDNQSKTVYVNYDGDKLTIQTPLVNIPYNINDFNQENDKYKKFDMNLSFGGMDGNPKLKQFFDKMVEMKKKSSRMLSRTVSCGCAMIMMASRRSWTSSSSPSSSMTRTRTQAR